MLKRHVAGFVLVVQGCFDFSKGLRYDYGEWLVEVGNHRGAWHHARSMRVFKSLELASVASVSFDDVAHDGTMRALPVNLRRGCMFETVQMTRLSSSCDDFKLAFHGE
ncbi:hypothetical protein LX36DRAFT_715904 [Colletotrichum falcatum]|nr:hypothetical protein LX36DRAFT_715904 [Colletotrichum falcatum]